MDPEKMIDSLLNELNQALRALGKAKTIEEKEAYSRIVKNLSESAGVFFNAISDMMMHSPPDEDD
ncbi:MAG: hypothetical protein C0394_06565 [Syntrophus sp. (in: bacteria)]|nr:hypothetical protein [Syntrophus sp. (in: bacteria)]